MEHMTSEQVEQLLRETIEWVNTFGDDDKDNISWMGKELTKLYTLCLDVSQTEYPDVDDYVCSRVIKLKRFISVSDLDRLHVQRANVGGIYAVMKGIVVSNEVGNRLRMDDKELSDRYKDEYYLGTIQLLPNGKYFILKLSEFTPSVLNMSTSYQVLNL